MKFPLVRKGGLDMDEGRLSATSWKIFNAPSMLMHPYPLSLGHYPPSFPIPIKMKPSSLLKNKACF